MNKFTNAEMMVHIPLCTSKDPKNVLLLSDDTKNLEDEVQKHIGIEVVSKKATLDIVRECKDSSYDVVILDAIIDDAAFLAHINRVLKEDALIVMKHPSLDKVEENKKLMQILGNYFKIIMPYNLGDGTTALLASKEYHPTADLILQRSDMLDNLNVYNCDLHIGVFAMPNYVRKEYLGVIKN